MDREAWVLWFMGSQRVGYDWVTELNWTEFTLIHGPNIPGSYAALLCTALDTITSNIHNWELLSIWIHLSLFLELLLHSSPVAFWIPIDLGSSSFSVISFCLFILFTVFSRQEYYNCLQLPSSVDHVLSELSTIYIYIHTYVYIYTHTHYIYKSLPWCLGWQRNIFSTFLYFSFNVMTFWNTCAWSS